MERIAPSARLEAQIAELLTQGLVDDGERLAEVGWLGARLVLQRAVEDEVTAFLGRARYQRTSEAAGSRNGIQPKPVQTAEGKLDVRRRTKMIGHFPGEMSCLSLCCAVLDIFIAGARGPGLSDLGGDTKLCQRGQVESERGVGQQPAQNVERHDSVASCSTQG